MKRKLSIVLIASLIACGGDSTSPGGPAEGTWDGNAVGAAIELRLFDRNSGELTGFGSVTPASSSGLMALIDPSLTGVRVQDSIHVVLAEGNRVAFIDGRVAGANITAKISGSAPFDVQGTAVTLIKQ